MTRTDRPHAPRPAWVAVVLTVVVLSGAALLSDAVRTGADRGRDLSVILAEVTSEANRLTALEWQAIGAGQLDPRISDQIVARHANLQTLTDRLDGAARGLSPARAEGAAEVRAALTAYAGAVALGFEALGTGDVARANLLARTRTQTAFERLSETTATLALGLNRDAARANLLARLGSLAVLLVALSALTALSRQVERARQVARSAERQWTRLREQDERDTLTGLPNRRGLLRRYRALPAGTPVAVVMIDLNSLKRVNDQEGHSAGDDYIRRVSNGLENRLPEGSVAARWGGDEFVLLLPGHDEAGAARVVRRAQRNITSPYPNVLPFAYGLVVVRAGDELDRALSIADARMYDQKEVLRGDTREVPPFATGAADFIATLERLDSFEDLLHRGMPMARDLVRFDAAFALGYEGGTFREQIWSDAEDGRRDRALPVTLLRLAHDAVERGGMVWSNDLPGDDLSGDDRAEAWVRSAALTAVHGPGGHVVGVVGVAHHRTWRAVTPQTRRIVESVALHATGVMERRQTQREMRRTVEGGMRALGIALDLRDRETAGHTQRVGKLAQKLGERLGLNAHDLEALRQGAFLHDLGKLTVPDAVLLKPDALDLSEHDEMSQHTTRGFEIASQIPGLHAGALQVIRSHHERWDGHGYPDGLAGEAIPLLARIFAVVDVYDALTSKRPYKAAWTPSAALDELRAGRDRDFDPIVLDAFVDLMTSQTDELPEPELDVETSSF